MSATGCAVQVEKQGKACRKELERALTRAAMDQDLGAIDEAEVVMTQKEHKLERLLTQKNMLDTALVRLTRSQNACVVYETERSIAHVPCIRLSLHYS